MAQELIDVGIVGNDGSGDSLYQAANKINTNFTELFLRPSVQSHIRMSGNEITSSESNADIALEASGTGAIVFPAIKFNGNNIEATRTNDDLRIVPSGTGAVSVAGLKVSGNKILSINSNDDIVISPPGTGAVDFGTFKINNNNIEGQRSNEEIKLIPSGSGKVIIASLGFGGTTISSDDSSSLNINEALIVDGTLAVSGNTTLTGTIGAASGSLFGTLSFADGVINDYLGGSISFGDENLTTTGTLSAATGSQFGNLDLLNGTINDSSGAISFGDEDISTTGTLTGVGTLTASSITTTGDTGLTGTITIDNLTFNDNIIASTSNADINLTPSGTGVVNISNLTIDSSINLKDNVIQVTTSNADIELKGSGTGSVALTKVNIDAGNIDNTVIGAATPAAGTFTTLTFDPAASGTLSTTGVTITDNSITASQSNANLELSGNGSGAVSINGFTLPGSDGSTGQILRTDGSKALTFVTSPILLGVTDIQDGTAEFTFKSETTVDHVITTGGHELLDSTQRVIHTFATSKYDSIFYHSVTRDDASDELSTNLYSVVHGTSSDSSVEAFVSESHITKTGTNNQLAVDADVLNGSLRLLGTGFNPTCSMSFYAIGLGDDDSSGYTGEPNASLAKVTLGVAEKTTIDHVTESGTNANIPNTEAQLTTFDKTQFDSAWFLGVTKDITNSKFATTKISAVHNNDSVYVSQSSVTRSSLLHTFIPTITGDIEVAINGTGSSAANSFAYYRIGLGDNDSTGYSGEEEAGVVINTDVDSASETFDSWAHASFRGAKYYISVNNDTKTELTNMEVLVVHDGTDAYVTVYNIVNTKDITDNMIDVTAAISGSNVEVSMSGFDTNLRVHAYRILLSDAEADRSGTNVSVIGDVDVGNYTVTAADHVTAAVENTEDFSSQATFDNFDTSKYDSAWYHFLTKNETTGTLEFHKFSVNHGTSSDSSTEAFVSDSQVIRTQSTPVITADADTNNGKLRLRVTGHNDGSTTVSVSASAYRIGLGDDDSSGYVNTESNTATAVINTDVDSASESFDSWAHASYRGAKYYISINNASKNEISNVEAVVVHNGTDAFIHTYNLVNTGNNDQIALTAAIVGGNVVVSIAGNESNLRVHAYRILLSDSESNSTGTNVNVIGDKLVSNTEVTTVDHVTATIDNTEDFSSENTFDSFTNSKYDSAWYHFIAKDETNGTLEFHKFSVNHGTSSDSSTDAFISDSHVIRTQSTPVVTADADTNNGNTRVLLTGHNDGSTTVSVSTAAYRIGLGDDDSSGYVNEESNTATAVINTDVDSASESFDSWAHGSYRGAKYYISINNTSKNEISNVEAVVVHNGTDAFIHTYNLVNTGNNDLINLTAAIDGSNVVVSISGVETNLRVHAYRILLSDSESDSTGTNVNIIGNETVTNYVVTTIDHVTATVDNTEDFSSEETFDQWSSSSFDSAWYHVIVKDETNDAFSFHKYSVCHGTSSDSSAEAFITDSGEVRSETVPIVTADADVNNGNVRVRLTAHNDGSSAISVGGTAYRIALGDNDSTGYSGEQEAGVVINADVDSASETFDSWAHGSFRGAKYYISINNDSKTEVANVEALVVHDGTNAMITTYNEHGTGDNPLATFTAAIVGSNVVVSCAGLETNLRITAYRILLADDEADRTGTNVNVIGEVTVSSSATTLDTFSTNSYQGAHYIIVGTKSNDSCIMEASVISNGSEAFISEGPQVSTQETPMLTLAASHSSTTTTVTAASTAGGSTTVNAYRIHIARGEVVHKDAIDTFASSSYKAGHYIVVGKNEDDVSQIAEVTVLTDGTSSFITTGADISTNSTTTPLMTFTTDYTSGNARLLARNNVALSTTTVNAYRIHVARGAISTTDIIDTFSSSTYKAGHYIIVGKNQNDISQIAEVTVLTDGVSSFITTGADITTNSTTTPLMTFTTDYTGGTARLLAANNVAGSITTVNAYRIHINRGTISTTDLVDSFASDDYDGAHYIVVAKNESDQSQIAEVTVVTDGSGAFHSVGPTISTHSTSQQLLEFTSDYESGSAKLFAANTQSATNSKVNAYRVHFKAPADTVQNVDSFAKSSARGAKYYVSINDLGNNRVENVQILVVHNGTNAFMNVYGNTNTHTSDLVTFSVDIDSSNNVRLRAIGTSSNTRVHAYRILLADDETDSSSTNVNVIGEVTVSSAATFFDSFDTGSQQGAFYIIVATKNNDSAILEATVVSDGTDAFVSQGPQVSTEETPLISLTASHASTTTTVNAAATTGGSTTVNAYRINIARGESTASQQTTLNEFDASTFRSAAYVMQITDTETPNYELFEARVTHDGSDAFISKFGRIGNTTTELAAITADISGGNVRLRGQITNTNTTQVKFVRRILKV